MKLNLLLLSVVLLFLIINLQCKAPRNNPLDPLNPDYDYGTIEGVVQSVVGPPFVGISDVKVLWQNSNIIAETGNNGRFILSGIPIEDGNIIFSKEGYKSDTLNVTWGSNKNYFVQVYFNRIPSLDSLSIYTIVINQTGLQPLLYLNIKADITDPDRGLDSVFVFNKSINLKKYLTFSFTEGIYQAAINESELSDKNLEKTIGLDFSIIAKDRFQNEFNIGEERVTRIIKSEVSDRHPSTDSSINISNQPVVLRWSRFNAAFEYNYLVELYSFTFQQIILVESKANIHADSTRHVVQNNLPEGNYYWVIWVRDKFQNQSRSIPVNFRIVDPTPP